MGGCFSSVVFFFDGKSSDDDNEEVSSSSNSSARVISVKGDLREYPIPFTVSQLVQSMAIREAADAIDSFFVCNSDSLTYDDYIPALDNDEFLQPNQMYFILPKTKLQYRLSASDMAALAVKATLALQNSPESSKSSESSSSAAAAASKSHQLYNKKKKKKKKKKKTRISPVALVVKDDQHHQHLNAKSIIIREENETKSFLMTTSLSNSKPLLKSSSSNPPPPISRSGSIRKLQRYSSKRAKMAVRSFRLRLTTIYEGHIL